MKKRILCFIIAVLCACVSASALAEYNIPDDDEPIVLEFPMGGVKVIEPHEVKGGDVPDITKILYTASYKPGFYNYGTDYGRKYLEKHMNSEMVRCYDDLAAQCEMFEGNYSDVGSKSVHYSSGTETVYYMPQRSGTEYSYELTVNEIREVVVALDNDHPEWYWFDEFDYSFSWTSSRCTVNLIIADEYAQGDLRRELDNDIQDNFEEYVKSAERYMHLGEYMTAKEIHDRISENAEYSYYYYTDEDGNTWKIPSSEPHAHSIAAVLDNDSETMPVCEGYTKAYQLILNAVGIDNVYVEGIAESGVATDRHTWNLIRFDNGRYYWTDITWDDQSSSVIYNYFAKGSLNFEGHEPYTSEGSGKEFLYDLPAVPDNDFNVLDIMDTDLIYGMIKEYSGSCGNNMDWAVYENGVMYFEGEGYMRISESDVYDSANDVPWYKYRLNTEYLIIGENVRSVRAEAFYAHKNMRYAYLPNGIEFIGENAFRGCRQLKAIRIPDTVKKIDFGAFYNCRSLQEIYFNGTEDDWNGIDKSGADIPNDVNIVFQSDFTVEDIEIGLGTAAVEIKKNTDFDESARVILAVYDKDIFSFLLVKEYADNDIMTFEDERLDTTKQFKVFLWNSLENMKPLSKQTEYIQ